MYICIYIIIIPVKTQPSHIKRARCNPAPDQLATGAAQGLHLSIATVSFHPNAVVKWSHGHLAVTRYCHDQYCMLYGIHTGGSGGASYIAQ